MKTENRFGKGTQKEVWKWMDQKNTTTKTQTNKKQKLQILT